MAFLNHGLKTMFSLFVGSPEEAGGSDEYEYEYVVLDGDEMRSEETASYESLHEESGTNVSVVDNAQS